MNSEAPPTNTPPPPQSAPEANQTGEVRLLSKLLNHKVDTARCVRSGGSETLTVQGLGVSKESRRLGEKRICKLGNYCTFRCAYTTVINQSKRNEKKRESKTEKQQRQRQHKRLKRLRGAADGRSRPHFFFFLHSFAIRVKSSSTGAAAPPPPPPACCRSAA